MQFTLREVLEITKKELHDRIIDLVRRKWLPIERENEQPVDVKATIIDEVTRHEEYADNQYMRSHWARAMIETPVPIKDVKDSVVALIHHGLEMNLVSLDFYKKGKCSINTKH